MNIKRLLDAFKLIGYGLLLLVDEGITVLSMFSVGHTIPEKIGLAVFAFIIVLLGAWVFLSGIRAHGAERTFKLAAWALSVVLIVAINWAFTRTMITTQSSDTTTTQTESGFDERIRQTQIESYLKQIEALTKKLDSVNVWREADRKAIADDIESANAAIIDLQKKPEQAKVKEVVSMNVFKKMSEPIGGNQELVADLFWIVLFLVAQLFTVLAAPKGEEDAKPTKRKREPKTVDLSEWVERWVNANWMSVRNPTQKTPYSILPIDVFRRYIRGHWRAFPIARYRTIERAASSSGAIEGSIIVIEDEKEAVELIKKDLTNKLE